MPKRLARVFLSMAPTAVLAALLGCGGASVEASVGGEEGLEGDVEGAPEGAPEGADPRPKPKPFDAPTLKGGGGSGGSAVRLGEEDEKVIVPGSQYGEAPPIQTAKKRRKKGGEEPRPYSETILEQMGDLGWGMTYRKVLSLYEKRVRDSYKDQREAVAGDALADDELRTKELREITKLRKSYIEFKGQRTGFEGHMVAQEFTHNNGESMMVYDAGKFVEYLFFFDGRLWKRVQAFRKDSFQTDLTFPKFLATVEGRFGVEGKLVYNDEGDLETVQWRDEETYAEVVDRSAFFGAYCIRYTAAVTETYLAKLRTHKGREDGKVEGEVSSMIDAVTSGSGDSLTDGESSVIDQWTGEAHGQPGDNRLDATHSVTAGKGKKKKAPEKDAEEAPPEEKAPEPDDDPLADIF